MFLDTLISIGQGISIGIDVYKNVSTIIKGDKIKQFDQDSSEIERLSDNILYAPNLHILQDVTKREQRYVEDLREVRESLEQVQQAFGEQILSSAMILTPEKMQKAISNSPWDALLDVRPINVVSEPSNSDMIPVLFYHNEMPFIGWQTSSSLPNLFNCHYDLWFPDTGLAAKESKYGDLFQFETVIVDAWGKVTDRCSNSAYQITELINDVPLEMVYIPAGTFMMGSLKDEKGQYADELPQHQVTLEAFYMSKYPITQKQWQAVMGTNPSNFKGINRPVDYVSWHEAVEFCKQVSKLTEKNYRLPSESEWEYACRAGTNTPFYFGETISTDFANYNCKCRPYASEFEGIAREETSDVGIFPANPFGLYDMHGNVLEWCADPWHGNYNGARNDGKVWEHGGDSLRRILRGGSWEYFPRPCRSAYRYRKLPVTKYNNVGFRIAI